MLNSIISGSVPPQYLSSDNDPLFLVRQWNANLRILDVTEVKTVPYVCPSRIFVCIDFAGNFLADSLAWEYEKMATNHPTVVDFIDQEQARFGL